MDLCYLGFNPHSMTDTSLHTFHIPVMGLAYTIDSPIKVARFGINSVVSIIEDNLIERMRKYYSELWNEDYTPITPKEDDYRARRVTHYLNLMNRILKEQVARLKSMPFAVGSEVSKYFEMLPTHHTLRSLYHRMLGLEQGDERTTLAEFLKSKIRAGRIDVNIMTKVDKDNYDKNGNALPDSSDALAALRGYANSELTDSAIVFSAGLNPRLFNYLAKLPCFYAKGWGHFDKEVIIKVSDYRSALIQGKYLAKKGIWVSEFRIESPLNCGGHAFASDGALVGPILESFRANREELVSSLHALYHSATLEAGRPVFDAPHPLRISVQGGIGTHEEDAFLRQEYGVSGTGWGTPFLLCPEATTVDDETLSLLARAREEDVILSNNSPLGVRFNYLKGTSAEKEKQARIKKGKPGSPCTEKHLVSDTEFTKAPICTASRTYQKRKIEQLQQMDLAAAEYERRYEEVVNKECLCVGLSNAAIVQYDLTPIKNLTAVTICPGPNIAYFDEVVTLKQMTDHIYGRGALQQQRRPHMFIKELQLNIDYLQEQLSDVMADDSKRGRELNHFATQLAAGIEYYRSIAAKLVDAEQFLQALDVEEGRLKSVALPVTGQVSAFTRIHPRSDS